MALEERKVLRESSAAVRVLRSVIKKERTNFVS